MRSGFPSTTDLLIVQVTPGGSADQAGLRAGTERAYLGNIPIMLGGDLIVAIDGQKVEDEEDLVADDEQPSRRRHRENNHLPQQAKNGCDRRAG